MLSSERDVEQGTVIRDIRGTPEARDRIRKVAAVTGVSFKDLLAMEPEALP